MSYIGNTSTTQTYAAAIDTFNGDGTTTAFTLSRPVATVAQIEVVVNNVQQAPGSYTVSGNTLTFTGAPSSGTANIYVYYTSPVTQVIAPSTGTVGTAQLDIANFNGTGAMTLPTGNTAQRPASPVRGNQRFNTTTGYMEYYNGTSWITVDAQYSIAYLVVAGGGGGNAGNGGGAGGAGGVQYSAATLVMPGTAYTVTVGGGGAGGIAGGAGPASGTNSSMLSLTAISGGYGGTGNVAGAAGGSGGGGGYNAGGGSGTAGQGNAGGSGTTTPYAAGGGGGGYGAVGGNASGSAAGSGGVGGSWSITGASVYYAGGGGGGSDERSSATGGSGGNGGGGAGGQAVAGTSGTPNTGGGGGGGGRANSGTPNEKNGGNGGSGVVIVSYAATVQKASGGSVTSYTSGGVTYWVHTFTTSGTFTA